MVTKLVAIVNKSSLKYPVGMILAWPEDKTPPKGWEMDVKIPLWWWTAVDDEDDL